jgi:hypothetical protein
MDIFERIERRWGFRVPPEYVSLSQSGVLDYERPEHLRLTHIKEWFIPAQVEGQTIPEYWRPGFIPFASTHMGDYLCWALDWKGEAGVATAFCFRGDYAAEGYAPNFAGSIYRALIDEFSGSRVGENSSIKHRQETLQGYVTRVAEIMPAAWLDTLQKLSRRELRITDRGAAFLEKGEADEIIRRHLDFEHLNQEIRYIL